MNTEIDVKHVRFTAATRREQKTGLLGWASCIVDHRWAFDRIAVRRTRRGRLALSFPAKQNGNGDRSFYVRPINDETRRAIEREIFDHLPFGESRNDV